MNREDYKHKRSEMLNRHSGEIAGLEREFALSNSDVNVGDIVVDHISAVDVRKIKYTTFATEFPCCVYEGYELTKKMKRRKNKNIRYVDQRNVKEVISVD